MSDAMSEIYKERREDERNTALWQAKIQLNPKLYQEYLDKNSRLAERRKLFKAEEEQMLQEIIECQHSILNLK